MNGYDELYNPPSFRLQRLTSMRRRFCSVGSHALPLHIWASVKTRAAYLTSDCFRGNLFSIQYNKLWGFHMRPCSLHRPVLLCYNIIRIISTDIAMFSRHAKQSLRGSFRLQSTRLLARRSTLETLEVRSRVWRGYKRQISPARANLRRRRDRRICGDVQELRAWVEGT